MYQILKRAIPTLLSLLTLATAQANQWQVGLHVGAGIASSHSSAQRITLADGLVNLYTPQHKDPFIVAAGASVNYHFQAKNLAPLTLGLRGEYLITPNNITKGTVHPLINEGSDFDTLNYKHKMSNYLFLAQAQWDWRRENTVHPYINLGAGVVWNRLFKYTESTPAGSSAAPAINAFRAHNQAHFAYALGLGLQFKQYQFGYHMLALGKSRLGTTRVQSSNEFIRANNIYVHLIEFTYYFK